MDTLSIRFVTHLILRAICVLAIIGSIGCARAQSESSSSKVDHGQEVQASDSREDPESIEQVHRFVALSPALGVMLRDLGFEDSIVARHSYDSAISRSIPAIGTHLDLDYELLISLEPTRIYLEKTSAPTPPKLIELSEQHGWELVSFELKTLDDIARTLDNLYLSLIGFQDRSNEVDSILKIDVDPLSKFQVELPSARLANAWSPIGSAAKRAGTTLVLAGIDPPGAMGPGSFHDQMITRLGLKPALTQGGMWQELDHEDLIELAPESILIFSPKTIPEQINPNDLIGEPVPMSWEEIEKELGSIVHLDIPAIQHRRVAIITHPLGLLPSSSLGQVADDVRSAVEGWE